MLNRQRELTLLPPTAAPTATSSAYVLNTPVSVAAGRDWTYRGQLITGNRFENISSYLCQAGGAKNCRGQAPRALHSDDGMSGWTVLNNLFRNATQVHNAYSSRDITFAHNRIEHVLSNESLNENQLCAIHLDVMRPQCEWQRKFLERVPYDCGACPWAGPCRPKPFRVPLFAARTLNATG